MKTILSLTHLKLGQRLALGFAILMAMLVAVTGLAVGQVGSINASLATIGDLNSVKQRFAINFRGSVHDRAIALRDLTLVPTKPQVTAEIERIQKLAGDYTTSAGPLDAMAATPEFTADEHFALVRIKEVEARTLALTARVIDLRLADKEGEAVRMVLEQARPAYVDWLASINRLIDLEEAKNKAESAQARSVAEGFTVLMLVQCGSAIGFGALIAWFITSGILEELGTEPKTAALLASAVAQGDLSVRIELKRDDTTSLMAQLKRMQSSLAQVVSNVRRNSESVATASLQISDGNNDLSQRTERQASVLEETAASMDRLSATVKQNADNARRANELALGANAALVEQSAAAAESLKSQARQLVHAVAVFKLVDHGVAA